MSPRMHAAVTGATGLLGKNLLRALDAPIALCRDPARAAASLPGTRLRKWDPLAGADTAGALDGADVVYHLAGEPVADTRWSDAQKARIRDSRVLGTRALVTAMEGAAQRPSVLVSASAVGFYGDRGDEVLDETSTGGSDFLASVCAAWEAEAMAAGRLGVRVVCVRMGIVLAREGGALAKMLPPFKLGAGGRLGNGRQWMPWVHLDDAVGLLLHAASTPSLRGPMDAVSPNLVTNADFTAALGHALHRPAVIPVPNFALRVAFGEMAAVLTASQRALPRAAVASGYAFRYPELAGALADLVGG